MTSLKTPILTLILSVVSAVIQTLLVSYIAYKITGHFDLAVGLLSFFISFIVSFFIIYYLFNQVIFQKIDRLYLLVKEQQPKEIPNTEFQLDEVDSIDRLEEEIKKLAQERNKEADQNRNLDSYRKEFLGNVSHELKTPIFNIQGYLSTLIDGGINDPTINVEYLKRADKSVDRMIQIIDDLETISQLEIGTLELELETYDIAQQVKDILESLEFQASKQGIRLQPAKKYDKPILVKADKFRIRQVLVNLITNSIKYGKENGKTVVGLNLFDEQVIVEIKDNGIGIAEKHLPRLFERFYRVDKGRSREQGGTGLGLAIVKHIIEAHNETIDVESAINEGTTISFTLQRG
ncbi:MAG: histidine kinase [Bacteroidetes bacterium]|jgi:two-component system phosphate regulon sensor histidine kinase PhoR|nr:histidine kinase [Bacteroidota bacterium]MDF2453101.1 histidine kinase [Bacteroidota bacterium]